MTNRFFAVITFCLASIALTAQIQYSPPVPHTATPPTGAPTATGSRIRFDLSTYRLYQWSPGLVNWVALGQGIDVVAGVLPPAYTPTQSQSNFAINGATPRELYYHTGGGVWLRINSGDVYSVNGLTGAVSLDLSLTGNTLSLTGDGTTVNLAPYLDNTDAQSLSFNSGTGNLSISGGSGTNLDGRYLTSEVDGSTSNEIQAITAGDGAGDNKTLDLSLSGGTVTLDPAGIFTLARTGNTLTMTATEVDGSTTNELQTISANGAGPTSYTVDLSNGGGAVTLAEGSGIDLTRSTNTITIAATAAGTDLSFTGASSPVTLNSSSGADVTITAGGINAISGTSGNITITATEVDGSTSNELQTFGHAGTTSYTNTLSNGGGSFTLQAAGIAAISHTTGTVTITATEVDGSTSNELQTFGHSGTTSYTNTLSNGGGSFTLQAGGINAISHSAGTTTITATEVDGSTSNEIQAITAGDGAGDNKTLDLSLSGGTVTLDPAGIFTLGRTGNTLTMTATEVDGSTTNELQTITNSSDATSHTVTLSNSGGTVQLVEGANISLTTSGTGSAGVVTIAATGGTPTDYSIVRGYIEGQTGTTLDLDALDGVTKDVDGTNLAFDVPTSLENFRVYKNGIELNKTGTGTTRDYSANASTNSITLTTALVSTDRLIVQSVTGSALDLYTSTELTGAGTSTNPVKLAQQSATTGQSLAWNGSQYAPKNAPLQVKGITIQNPTASENIALFYIDRAITIGKVAEAVRGTSPSVTYNIRFASTRDSGTPTDVFSANRAATSTSGVTTTTFNDNTIPAGSWVWLITSAQSGTVADFNVTLQYTED